jgi:hypothetical protein
LRFEKVISSMANRVEMGDGCLVGSTLVDGGGAVGFGVEVISGFVGEIVGVGVAFWLFI